MIPKLIAKFETVLSSGISATATTATIASALTKDGSNIPTGIYGFVIDEGTSNEEYIIATVTGTALSAMTRGLSYVDGTTSITALKQTHRKGSQIKITDHPALMQYNGVVDLYAGHWEGAVANYAALPTGTNDGEVRVTLDDSKLYVWDEGTTAWVLAGAGGGAGTMYTTVKLGSEADGADKRTFSMSTGSFPDDKYFQVYKNGVLMENGASADYQTANGNKAVFKYDVLNTDKITLVVISIDLYNPAVGTNNFIESSVGYGFSPTGSIHAYAGATAPLGWLLADGSAVSRSTYATLFSIISTTYGVGDGSTTFNLPNLKNRVIVGLDTSYRVSLDTCDAAWTAGSNVTATNDTGDKKEGTGSVKLSVAAGATATQILGYKTVSSANLVGKNTVAMWLKSSINLSSGDLKYQLDDTAAIASPLESINIPALVAGVWTRVYLTLATPHLDTAIISHGIYQQVDNGAFDLWIDDVAYGENMELSETGGEKNHTLTVEEMPAHTHRAVNPDSPVGGPYAGSVYGNGQTTGSTGGGLTHNVMQPYITLNYIIKT